MLRFKTVLSCWQRQYLQVVGGKTHVFHNVDETIDFATAASHADDTREVTCQGNEDLLPSSADPSLAIGEVIRDANHQHAPNEVVVDDPFEISAPTSIRIKIVMKGSESFTLIIPAYLFYNEDGEHCDDKTAQEIIFNELYECVPYMLLDFQDLYSDNIADIQEHLLFMFMHSGTQSALHIAAGPVRFHLLEANVEMMLAICADHPHFTFDLSACINCDPVLSDEYIILRKTGVDLHGNCDIDTLIEDHHGEFYDKMPWKDTICHDCEPNLYGDEPVHVHNCANVNVPNPPALPPESTFMPKCGTNAVHQCDKIILPPASLATIAKEKDKRAVAKSLLKYKIAIDQKCCGYWTVHGVPVIIALEQCKNGDGKGQCASLFSDSAMMLSTDPRALPPEELATLLAQTLLPLGSIFLELPIAYVPQQIVREPMFDDKTLEAKMDDCKSDHHSPHYFVGVISRTDRNNDIAPRCPTFLHLRECTDTSLLLASLVKCSPFDASMPLSLIMPMLLLAPYLSSPCHVPVLVIMPERMKLLLSMSPFPFEPKSSTAISMPLTTSSYHPYQSSPTKNSSLLLAFGIHWYFSLSRMGEDNGMKIVPIIASGYDRMLHASTYDFISYDEMVFSASAASGRDRGFLVTGVPDFILYDEMLFSTPASDLHNGVSSILDYDHFSNCLFEDSFPLDWTIMDVPQEHDGSIRFLTPVSIAMRTMKYIEHLPFANWCNECRVVDVYEQFRSRSKFDLCPARIFFLVNEVIFDDAHHFLHVPTAASTSYNHYLINTLEIAEPLAPLPSLHLLLVLLQLSPSLDTHQLLFSLPTPVTPSSESLYRFFLPSYSLMKYCSEVPRSSAFLPMSMFASMTSCKTIFLSDNDGYINLSFDDGCSHINDPPPTNRIVFCDSSPFALRSYCSYILQLVKYLYDHDMALGTLHVPDLSSLQYKGHSSAFDLEDDCIDLCSGNPSFIKRLISGGLALCTGSFSSTDGRTLRGRVHSSCGGSVGSTVDVQWLDKTFESQFGLVTLTAKLGEDSKYVVPLLDSFDRGQVFAGDCASKDESLSKAIAPLLAAFACGRLEQFEIVDVLYMTATGLRDVVHRAGLNCNQVILAGIDVYVFIDDGTSGSIVNKLVSLSGLNGIVPDDLEPVPLPCLRSGVGEDMLNSPTMVSYCQGYSSINILPSLYLGCHMPLVLERKGLSIVRFGEETMSDIFAWLVKKKEIINIATVPFGEEALSTLLTWLVKEKKNIVTRKDKVADFVRGISNELLGLLLHSPHDLRLVAVSFDLYASGIEIIFTSNVRISTGELLFGEDVRVQIIRAKYDWTLMGLVSWD